jgi:hypothetical protein
MYAGIGYVYDPVTDNFVNALNDNSRNEIGNFAPPITDETEFP